MTAIAPTTKLDAINIMLSHQGEEPYNSLTGEVSAEVRSAELVLDEILKEVLSMGWLFNSEEEVSLPVNGDGEIDVPTDAINLTFPLHPSRKYTTRRGKLYDRDNNTHTIASAVKVNLMRLMELEDCPEVARKYVATRAGREYQARYLASDSVNSFTERSEFEAMTNLIEEEGTIRNASIMDSHDVHAGILGGRGGGIIRGGY